jgi:hypothetical protein
MDEICNWISTVFFGLILKATGSKLTFKEIEKRSRIRKYDAWVPQDGEIGDAAIDTLLDMAKIGFEQNISRQTAIDGKMKNLLALSVFSASVNFALLDKNQLSKGCVKHLFVSSALIFSVTILLLIFYWGLNTSTGVSVEREFLSQSGVGVKKLLLIDYFKTNDENGKVIDFLAAVFESARRVFLLGFLLLAGGMFLREFLLN